MVIDSSVLIAILTDEPDAADFEALIEADSVRLISAATYLETAMVIESRLGPAGGREPPLLDPPPRFAEGGGTHLAARELWKTRPIPPAAPRSIEASARFVRLLVRPNGLPERSIGFPAQSDGVSVPWLAVSSD